MTQATTQGEQLYDCQECGRLVEAGTYHPYWHCVLQKSGQLDVALESIAIELTKARLEGAANYVTTVYGERCEAKDTDEFPGIDEDPKATRCLVCREWEYYDEWASSLTTQLKKGE